MLDGNSKSDSDINDKFENNNSACKTLAEVRKWASAYLANCDIHDPIKESDFLLAYLLDKDRSLILAYPRKHLSPKTVEKYCELVKQRGAGIPLAYLTGKKEFMGLDFNVTENVLIPRPDTEILVEAVLEMIDIEIRNDVGEMGSKQNNGTAIRLLDLCTGSGNIALSVGYHCKNELNIPVYLTLADISPKALEVAKQNACDLGLNEYCQFVESDLFANIPSEEVFDIITVNPPYVSPEEYRDLSKEVKNEPEKALIAEEQGLVYYKLIAKQYSDYLSNNGWLFMEIGAKQQERVESLFNHEKLVKTKRDLAGHPRVTMVY